MRKSTPPKDSHKDHEQELVIGDFGPHKGKFVCKQCNKWVRWASAKEIKEHESAQ